MKNKVKVNQKPGAKRKVNKSFLCVVFVFIISLLVILSTTVFFPINSVSLDYSGKLYTKEQILKSADIKIGENIIILPSKKISQKVTENLTYIGELKIKKQFPDKILLTATETSEAYCIKAKKQYLFLDNQYKVLREDKKPNKKLGCINGIKLQNSKIGTVAEFKDTEQQETLLKIVKQLKKGGDKLNYINFKSGGEVEFYVNKKFKIQLGSTAELDDKLSFMTKMIDEISKKNKHDTGRINLTYFPSKKEGYFTREDIKIKYF